MQIRRRSAKAYRDIRLSRATLEMPAERQPEGPVEEADRVCRRASAPNPKFAQRCREAIANFGFKRGTRSIDISSVPLVPKFASEPAAMLCELRNRDTSPMPHIAQRTAPALSASSTGAGIVECEKWGL